MIITELINGCTLGLEHIAGEPDDPNDGLDWAICLSLFIFRISLCKMK